MPHFQQGVVRTAVSTVGSTAIDSIHRTRSTSWQCDFLPRVHLSSSAKHTQVVKRKQKQKLLLLDVLTMLLATLGLQSLRVPPAHNIQSNGFIPDMTQETSLQSLHWAPRDGSTTLYGKKICGSVTLHIYCYALSPSPSSERVRGLKRPTHLSPIHPSIFLLFNTKEAESLTRG